MSDSNFDFNDQLALDPRIKKEIAAEGLAYRWINASKFKAAYGYDSRQWQPYKRDDSKKGALENNSFGYRDADGHIRRGDLILAVRSLQVHNMAKARNRSKIDGLAGAHRKKSVEQIKQSFQEAGLKDITQVHDGYDENE